MAEVNSSEAFDCVVRAGNPEFFDRDGARVSFYERQHEEVCIALSVGSAEEENKALAVLADWLNGREASGKKDRLVGIYSIPVAHANKFRAEAFHCLDEVRAGKPNTLPQKWSETQLKSLRPDWWGYFVTVEMTTADDGAVGEILGICNELGIDYRQPYSWIPAAGGEPHRLTIIMDNQKEDDFRQWVLANEKILKTVTFLDRDFDDQPFRREDAPRDAIPYLMPLQPDNIEVENGMQKNETKSYIVIFADTVDRDSARQSLQAVFDHHAAGRIVREHEYTTSFTVKEVDGAMLREINQLPGLYGVDENIQFDLAGKEMGFHPV